MSIITPRPTRHAVGEIEITATAPIHHGAFGVDLGNAVTFRRMPLAQFPDHAGIPAVSGNALRGALRRIVMRDVFKLCELSRETVVDRAWDRLYGALANGGYLDGSETTVDPTAHRALRDAVPALSVLGAALYQYMLPGRVSVGWLWPVCTESVAAGLCTAEGATLAAEELLTEVALVRHVDREQQDPKVSGVTPMPVTVEALKPGTRLQSRIAAQAALTETEESVLGWGLDQLRAIGAKSASGFGWVEVRHTLPVEAYGAWRDDAAAVDRATVTLRELARAVSH